MSGQAMMAPAATVAAPWRVPPVAWLVWLLVGAMAAVVVSQRAVWLPAHWASWCAAAVAGAGLPGLLAVWALAAALMAVLLARRARGAMPSAPARITPRMRHPLRLVVVAGLCGLEAVLPTAGLGAAMLGGVVWLWRRFMRWRWRRLVAAPGAQRAARRPWGAGLLLLLHAPVLAALMLVDDVLRVLGALLRWLMPWCWRAGLAWAVAGAIWLLLAPLVRDSSSLQFAPAFAPWRHALLGAPSAGAATLALLGAAGEADPAKTDSVLRAGADAGVFELSVPSAGCIDWLGLDPTPPAAQLATLREGLQRTGVRLSVTQALRKHGPTAQTLVLLARCELAQPLATSLVDWTAAARSIAPDLMLPVVEAAALGHPALTAWALQGPGRAGADATQDSARSAGRDWQGRTPLMAALDTLAAARAAGAPGHTLALMQANVDLLMAGAGRPAPDRAGRSLAYLMLRAGLAPAQAAPWLDETTAAARTAAGETLAHALARGGAGADAWDDARQRLPGAPGLRADTPAADGSTPLHVAQGAHAAHWLLTQPGVDPERADARGRTALHAAVLRRDVGAALVLLRFTAARERRDDAGRSVADDLPPAAPGAADLWKPLRQALAERAPPGWPP